MKREELIAMGISEENVEKIIADYGSAVQREQAKAAELKAKADTKCAERCDKLKIICYHLLSLSFCLFPFL